MGADGETGLCLAEDGTLGQTSGVSAQAQEEEGSEDGSVRSSAEEEVLEGPSPTSPDGTKEELHDPVLAALAEAQNGGVMFLSKGGKMVGRGANLQVDIPSGSAGKQVEQIGTSGGGTSTRSQSSYF